MKNYHIKKLAEHDPLLYKKLRDYCYDLNGCCQIVHSEMGPWLNEYMYQDALEIILEEKQIKPVDREHYFSVEFRGHKINHRHFVDFFVRDKVYIECKAVEALCSEHRQQLWNYMRLTKVRIGILWNFAPVRDQSEHYYLDTDTDEMYMF